MDSLSLLSRLAAAVPYPRFIPCAAVGTRIAEYLASEDRAEAATDLC
jgi:hypothetical protein